MAELQPVAFSPFCRIRTTAAFRSSCVGESEGSHLKLCLYHSSVDGETFVRNWRSRMNSENPIRLSPSEYSNLEENRINNRF